MGRQRSHTVGLVSNAAFLACLDSEQIEKFANFSLSHFGVLAVSFWQRRPLDLGSEPVGLGAGVAAIRAAEALGDVIRFLTIDGGHGGRAQLSLIKLPDPDLATIGERQASSDHQSATHWGRRRRPFKRRFAPGLFAGASAPTVS